MRQDEVGGLGRVLPGAVGIDEDLHGRRARPATGAAAWRWGGRRRAGRRPAVRPARRRRRAAARRSGRRRTGRVRAPESGSASSGQPAAAAKSAAARPSGLGSPGLAARAPRGRRPRRRGAPRRRCAASVSAPARGSGATDGPVERTTQGRPSGRPPPSSSPSGSSRMSGSRSGTLRCTTPGRPSSAVHTARQANARIQRRRSGVGVVDADLDEQLDLVAEELDLVDRLPGPGVAQLGRAVGGQDDERAPAPRAPRRSPGR